MMKVKVINKSKYDLPEYKTPGSAGFDFHASLSKSLTILPGRRAIIPTGLFMELPKGTYLKVQSRSGLALRNGIFVLNSPGTVDSDYRDEICVILANFGDQPFEVKPGDRIAQGIISKYEVAEFEEVTELSKEEDRGGGFGHTGVES